MAFTGVSSAEYKYVFVPASDDDNSPLTDWGGALFLDAPMSTDGSLSDVLPGSFLKTEYGSFNLSDGTDVTSTGAFTWTPAIITSMNIGGLGPLNVDGSLDQWTITSTTVGISIPDPMATGVWVASSGTGVPDSVPTAMLIGLTSLGLWGFGNFCCGGQLAMARRKK